jgi:cell division protein FtsB
MRKGRAVSAGGSWRRSRRAVETALVCLGCLLLVQALVGEKGFFAGLRARDEYQALEQALTALRAENAQLREDAKRLREDPVAIEELARRDLGLLKPGEKLFIIRERAPRVEPGGR